MSARDLEIERRLAEVRNETQPAPADKARILASVRAAIGTGLPAGVPPPAVPAAPMSGRLAYALSAGAVFGLLGLLGGFVLGRRTEAVGVDPAGATASSTAKSEPDPVVVEQPTPVVIEQPASVLPQPTKSPDYDVTLPPARVAAAAATEERAASKIARSRRAFTLAEGLELLAQAERALHANDPALALALLGDFDRRAPRSMLRQERLTTHVLASCAARDASGARDARDDLQREFPNSIYSRRLERACNGGSSSELSPATAPSNTVPANHQKSGH